MGEQQVWSVTACVFLFLSLASQIQCLKEKDLIEKLPGQPTVNFRQYGGYVAINETSGSFFYYYFTEAIEAKDSAPLVLWFNGGPGASSLVGAFLEHGPFRIQSDGKTLYRNPYAWNNKANVLYLESLAKVGFSYTNTESDMQNQGDEMSADDNYTFLVNWLERFPEYKGRELYISGQSYVGHYGPQLAQTIIKNQRNKQAVINLGGLLIGNPLLDRDLDSGFEGEDVYLMNHGLYPQELMDTLAKYCYGDLESPTSSDMALCAGAGEKQVELTKGIDKYSIYEDTCLDARLTSKPKKHATVMKNDLCGEAYLTAYLNTPNVQEAMHANTTKLSYPWQIMNNDILNYYRQQDTNAKMLPNLQELMGEGIRIWIYNGDADAVVAMTATIKVLKMMNLTVEKTWRPWFSGGQVGGYTESYGGNLTYATVRGAGHSVPALQPVRALTLFTSFIGKTPLPEAI